MPSLSRFLCAVVAIMAGAGVIAAPSVSAAGTRPFHARAASGLQSGPQSGMRSFIMPRGRNPGAPAPQAAPRVRVERSLAPPPGMLSAYQAATIRFVFACSAAQAAMMDAGSGAGSPGLPPCPEPLVVVDENP